MTSGFSRAFLVPAAIAAIISTTAAAQTMDPDFARSVKTWTTRPEFSSPLVDHLPLSATIPSPKVFFGEHIGAPNKLHSQPEIIAYFRKLAAAAPDRVHLIDIGKTNEGRDNIVVLISDAANIGRIDAIRSDLGRLADPRGLSAEDASTIISRTKPIYHLTAGLHSSETGPPEMVMELAYRLLTEDSAMIRKIRDNVVVAISPVLEGDGRDRYVQWYDQSLVDETDDRNLPPGPPYWGKYIYHDNNRDINYSDVSARQLLKYYLEWHPPIMHELHESIPFLYSYSGQAPQNPELDPILYGELPFFSNFEMSQLTKYGMPGVWTHGFVDAWSPGYVGFMSSNHNGMLRMYETFGNEGATTMLRRIKRENDRYGKQKNNRLSREWYRPSPPYEEVMWSLRNNINFMQTGVLTALQLTSEQAPSILENFYRKSLNSVSAGATKPPYVYVIPAGQEDPTRVAFLVNLLRTQGIEVGIAQNDIRTSDGGYPKGSFVVRLDQPYGRLAKTLLKVQDNFPDASMQTYDDAAWTMGLMAGVEVKEIDDKAVLQVPTDLIERYDPRGSVNGSGDLVVLDNGSLNLATLRYRLVDVPLRIVSEEVKASGRTIPPGSIVVPAGATDRLRPLVEELGLTATSAPASLATKSREVRVPRLGVYSTWGSTQSVGWLRYAFDRTGTSYDLLYKEQLRAGNLRGRYDVIILPSQGRDANNIVFDLPMRGKALPYRKTPETPALGAYGESDDIRGGMGLEGLIELRKFVDEGGLLITTGTASQVPTSFGLVPDVTAAPKKDLGAPGPIVSARIRQPGSPIFYGYSDPVLPVRWANDQLFAVPDRAQQQVLMEFPGGRANVLSGPMKEAAAVCNRPAIISTPVGKGRILMFATNPVWRWQNLREFRMLYNAVINWQHLDGATATAPHPKPARDLIDQPVFDDGSQSPSPDVQCVSVDAAG